MTEDFHIPNKEAFGCAVVVLQVVLEGSRRPTEA